MHWFWNKECRIFINKKSVTKYILCISTLCLFYPPCKKQLCVFIKYIYTYRHTYICICIALSLASQCHSLWPYLYYTHHSLDYENHLCHEAEPNEFTKGPPLAYQVAISQLNIPDSSHYIWWMRFIRSSGSRRK